ncbi:MAG: hypothetical protein HQ567_33580 [Candidatus Nealsonbacteria bacterium]|nr:hypothetical protein [Candidatus Nealsonbacteria bacterium]
MQFDIPKLLKMSIAEVKEELGPPKHEYIPTDLQLEFWPEFPFDAEYVKGNVSIGIEYTQRGNILSISIADDTEGSSQRDIMTLGNLVPNDREYHLKVMNWLNPAKARANKSAQIASIKVTPR